MIRQTLAITGVNLRSIPSRWGPSLVIIIGLAGVVAVFTALLSMAAGFEATLQATGSDDCAMILRGGSAAELNSALAINDASLIRLKPGIRKNADGKPLASAELVVITELFRKGETMNGSNISMRGVDPVAFELRPGLKVIDGEMFHSGRREMIVGIGVTRQFAGATLGSTLRMRGSEWKVVGVFSSGDAHESEIWCDAAIAQSTFDRPGYTSILAGLEPEGGLKTLQDALAADPQLNADARTEREYYASQTDDFRMSIGILAGVVTIIMAFGAIFAALNTMYAAVATRTREIGTLRAIGFGAMPVLVSVMVEAVTLSIIGGALGAALAWLMFDNLSVSTLGSNFTQVVFAFRVTPQLVMGGLIISIAIGFVGGLLPAWRAARLPVTTALRTS
ncbi:MAG: ABC transporter permease [Planctomycetota bacterium]